jgi:hypothetical protein
MDIRSLGYLWIESTDPANWLSFGTEVLGMMKAVTMQYRRATPTGCCWPDGNCVIATISPAPRHC